METILITGACGRIGSEISEQFIKKKNINLVIADINKSKLLKLKKKIGGPNIQIFAGDLTKKKDIINLIKFCNLKYKKIDTTISCLYPKNNYLFNNFNSVDEKSMKENIWFLYGSLILFSKILLKNYEKQKKGNLILFSSILGVKAPKFWHYKNSNISCPIEYSTSKAAIIHLTKYLAKYFIKKNIRVNCISPGGIEDNQSKSFILNYKKSCGNKGLLDSKDIIGTILFLASSDSKYINGQNIVIDDGWSL
jgi:NAD(P)-dependent dehydrogenase (short-subunit alcohol dehydrogenase family)